MSADNHFDVPNLYGRNWDILDHYDFAADDWMVGDFDGIGKVYINNNAGHVLLFDLMGRILIYYI